MDIYVVSTFRLLWIMLLRTFTECQYWTFLPLLLFFPPVKLVFPCESAFSFVLFTSLLYILDCTYKWYHTVLTFSVPLWLFSHSFSLCILIITRWTLDLQFWKRFLFLLLITEIIYKSMSSAPLLSIFRMTNQRALTFKDESMSLQSIHLQMALQTPILSAINVLLGIL